MRIVGDHYDLVYGRVIGDIDQYRHWQKTYISQMRQLQRFQCSWGDAGTVADVLEHYLSVIDIPSLMQMTPVCTRLERTAGGFQLCVWCGWAVDGPRTWLIESLTNAFGESGPVEQPEQPAAPVAPVAGRTQDGPPLPQKDGWNAVFDWYWSNRDTYKNLTDLARAIGYAPSTVKKEHSLYQARRK